MKYFIENTNEYETPRFPNLTNESQEIQPAGARNMTSAIVGDDAISNLAL